MTNKHDPLSAPSSLVDAVEGHAKAATEAAARALRKAPSPSLLLTVEVGDVDRDGRADVSVRCTVWGVQLVEMGPRNVDPSTVVGVVVGVVARLRGLLG